jgi:mono/diheme cytochrome c family protein
VVVYKVDRLTRSLADFAKLGLAVALLTIGAGSQALAAGDQARRQTLFSSRCGACHSLNALADPHLALAGLRGRAARSRC